MSDQVEPTTEELKQELHGLILQVIKNFKAEAGMEYMGKDQAGHFDNRRLLVVRQLFNDVHNDAPTVVDIEPESISDAIERSWDEKVFAVAVFDKEQDSVTTVIYLSDTSTADWSAPQEPQINQTISIGAYLFAGLRTVLRALAEESD